ncbi:hypothetical protein PoB_002437800 [Plakobranchus ocellatus]|uniref:Uncharacterized protein n=1 Tax=Plakobranchus ocellatus TaxID=259542 RepID=A0AAV3ZTS9_9GAST|nr:hypothetical protein PoB_002437800 [Plakobranchus ocellatus]
MLTNPRSPSTLHRWIPRILCCPRPPSTLHRWIPRILCYPRPPSTLHRWIPRILCYPCPPSTLHRWIPRIYAIHVHPQLYIAGFLVFYAIHVHPQLYIVGFLVFYADLSTSTLNSTSLDSSYSMLSTSNLNSTSLDSPYSVLTYLHHRRQLHFVGHIQLVIVGFSLKWFPLCNPQNEFPSIKNKMTAQFGDFALLFGLVVAAFVSEVNADAWSPVYCKACRRNFRITFCCRDHVNSFLPPGNFAHGLFRPPLREVIGHLPALGQNMQNHFFLFPAKTTGNHGRPTVSRSVRQEECVFRSCTKDLYRVTVCKSCWLHKIGRVAHH